MEQGKDTIAAAFASAAKKNRFLEMFEDNKGVMSSAKVCYFLVTVVLCFIIISMEIKNHTDATIIGIVAAMGAGVYGFNKQTEGSVQKTEINAANSGG